MKRLILSVKIFRLASLLISLAPFSVLNSGQVSAQEERASRLESGQSTSRNPPLVDTLDPATELEREIARGAGFTMIFRRTDLDTKAEAFAEVAVDGQRLLVGVHARNLPLPEQWNEQRYSLWVYLPNYEQKIYIGDLPIKLTSSWDKNTLSVRRRDGHLRRVTKKEPMKRGESDTVFRFTALPRGAVFGGLILTAEPARYEPIVNEPLRPLLIALVSDGTTEGSIAQPDTTAFPSIEVKGASEKESRPAQKVGNDD